MRHFPIYYMTISFLFLRFGALWIPGSEWVKIFSYTSLDNWTKPVRWRRHNFFFRSDYTLCCWYEDDISKAYTLENRILFYSSKWTLSPWTLCVHMRFDMQEFKQQKIQSGVKILLLRPFFWFFYFHINFLMMIASSCKISN